MDARRGSIRLYCSRIVFIALWVLVLIGILGWGSKVLYANIRYIIANSGDGSYGTSRNGASSSIFRAHGYVFVAQASANMQGEGKLEISESGSHPKIVGTQFQPNESVWITVKVEGEVWVGPLLATADDGGGFFLDLPLNKEDIAQSEVISVEAESDSTFASVSYKKTSSPTTVPSPQPPSDVQPTQTPIPPTPNTQTGATSDRPVCTCTITPTPTPTLTPTSTPSSTPTSTPIPSPTCTCTPTPTPTPMLHSDYRDWKGEYFNNVDFRGPASVVRSNSAISFEWGPGTPSGGVGKNWFSVRWTRQVVLPEGEYVFHLAADDWASVIINGEPFMEHRMNSHLKQSSLYVQKDEVLNIEIRYREYWGHASIHFFWTPKVGHCCWQGTYYCNPSLRGTPTTASPQENLNLRLDWTHNSPKAPLRCAANNGFSAQWARQIRAPGRAGAYYLCAYFDDGIRLWLDQDLLIDEWKRGEARLLCAKAKLNQLSPGHHLSIEYFQETGGALLGFWIVEACDEEPWIGAFFDNPHQEGIPVLIKTACDLNFNWETDRPDPRLPADNFSVRWQRTMELPRGTYNVSLDVDDSARLMANQDVVFDERTPNNPAPYRTTYTVSEALETLKFRLDYAEYTGSAKLRLVWASPTPTPTATLPATVTPALTVTPCCVTPTPTVK